MPRLPPSPPIVAERDGQVALRPPPGRPTDPPGARAALRRRLPGLGLLHGPARVDRRRSRPAAARTSPIRNRAPVTELHRTRHGRPRRSFCLASVWPSQTWASNRPQLGHGLSRGSREKRSRLRRSRPLRPVEATAEPRRLVERTDTLKERNARVVGRRRLRAIESPRGAHAQHDAPRCVLPDLQTVERPEQRVRFRVFRIVVDEGLQSLHGIFDQVSPFLLGDVSPVGQPVPDVGDRVLQ